MTNEELEMETYDRMKNALPWYEKGAEFGSLRVLNGALLIYEMQAIASRKLEFWDDALDYYSKALNNAKILYNDNNEKYVSKLINNAYYWSFCMYKLERYSLALQNILKIERLDNDI